MEKTGINLGFWYPRQSDVLEATSTLADADNWWILRNPLFFMYNWQTELNPFMEVIRFLQVLEVVIAWSKDEEVP